MSNNREIEKIAVLKKINFNTAFLNTVKQILQKMEKTLKRNNLFLYFLGKLRYNIQSKKRAKQSPKRRGEINYGRKSK